MSVRAQDLASTAGSQFRGISRRAELLYGGLSVVGLSLAVAFPAAAQSAPTQVGEVIVTANRRAQDVTSIPYNISAVGGEQLDRTRVTTVQDLAAQVPNLNISNNGKRNLHAQIPIIRGLNASGTVRASSLSQPPVATYLGNVVVQGYFPIDDIERVEILRGPQGTIYGAGSLGGTIRLIPTPPQFGEFGGRVEVSAGVVDNSEDFDRSISAVVNVPVNDALAFRISGRQEYEAGFIDQKLIMDSDGLLAPPTMADPTDVANSPAVYYDKEDVNWAQSRNARAALRWAPTDALEVDLAFNYADLKGEGSPTDYPYGGGPSPIDPRILVPPIDEYEIFMPTREPFSRTSRMASLDVSYDLGFATLSSTSSYLDTRGRNAADGTLGYIGTPLAFHQYYIGNPRNPRFHANSVRTDTDKTFAQEVRLVSQASDVLNYTVGLYFEEKKQTDSWELFSAGATAQSIASGGFLVVSDPIGRFVELQGNSKFTEKALFGELTWNVTPEWQITAGGRLFDQRFTRRADNKVFTFFIDESAEATAKVSDHILKLNSSYEFTDNHNVYATFSQGFRRGGANALSLGGLLGEPAELLTYSPDQVDNFEVGVKGRFDNGWRYTADIFYDDWTNPQIDLTTPANGWPAVVNGSKAISKGVELEASGPITSEFSLTVGYAYANAKIDEDFCIRTGDGGGGFIDCGIVGEKGARLPGSPKHSGSATLNYDRTFSDDSSLHLTLNVNYKGSVLSALPTPFTITPVLDDYWLLNGTAAYRIKDWTVALYVKNLANERALLGVVSRTNEILLDHYRLETVTTPRQVGLSLRYEF